MVIELDDAVLVVDTHSKPSAARALMDQIKARINAREYVVDSHFHWDHTQGTRRIRPRGRRASRSLRPTRRATASRTAASEIKRQLVDVPKEIDALKADLAKATDNARRTEIQGNITQAESYRRAEDDESCRR